MVMAHGPDHLARLNMNIEGGTMKYAIIYVPLGIAAIVLSAYEVFQPVEREHSVGHFGSLWDIAARPAGGPARVGLMFGGIAIVLMWISVIPRIRTAVLPVLIAIIGASCAILLITRPATGTPRPELTTSGTLLLLIAAAITVTASAQAMDYAKQRRRARQHVRPPGAQAF